MIENISNNKSLSSSAEKGLVSVITPCYNSEKYILKTIESVINQTYQNWEMIIVDDCSQDKSVQIIKDCLNKDDRIKLIQLNLNKGAGYCRNSAIKEAKGQYYAFLDSDDLWFKDKLEKQINFMKNNNIAFCYSAYNFIDDNGILLNTSPFFSKSKVCYHDLLKTNHIGCLTVIYDISKISDKKLYMSEIRSRQDLSLWLDILKIIDFGYGLNEVLASYRIRKKSVSSNKIKAIYYQWILYRNIQKFSFSKSIYFLIFYLYFGAIKYFKQL